jgi:hypothetical protein
MWPVGGVKYIRKAGGDASVAPKLAVGQHRTPRQWWPGDETKSGPVIRSALS